MCPRKMSHTKEQDIAPEIKLKCGVSHRCKMGVKMSYKRMSHVKSKN